MQVFFKVRGGLQKVNKNDKTTENINQNIFFKSTIKGINSKLPDFIYDEDIFEIKINNALENNGIKNKLMTLLKSRGEEGYFSPTNPYFEKSEKLHYCGDTAPCEIEESSYEYQCAVANESVLLEKVPLFQKYHDEIEDKEFNRLKIAAGLVGSVIVAIFTVGLGTPLIGASIAAAAGGGVNEIKANELKEQYTEILHKASIIAALKEAIVAGKITSGEVMDICRNN